MTIFGGTMNIGELKTIYRDYLQPIFKDKFRIDDSDEDRNWVVIFLDGAQEDFYFSLYGIDCVHLYWCNECFIFNKHRNDLVSSDTYGEIVFEADFDIEQLPHIIVNLILHLNNCAYVGKKEKTKGKIPSGYDDIKEYIITAKTPNSESKKYQLENITIEYTL